MRAAFITLGVPTFRAFLSSATLLRLTLSLVISAPGRISQSPLSLLAGHAQYRF
jgi:hypothetical protein